MTKFMTHLNMLAFVSDIFFLLPFSVYNPLFVLIYSLKESCFCPHRDISSEKVFFCQQLVRYGTICGSGGEFVNCGVRKDGTMGQWNTRLTAPWEHTCVAPNLAAEKKTGRFCTKGIYGNLADYTHDSLHK